MAIQVGLVQVMNAYYGHDYLPYSMGLLQATAQAELAHPDQFSFMTPVYQRLRIEETLERLYGADIVLFSAYVWNIRYSLVIAERLKARQPDTLIVFGGPQVPDQPLEFLQAHPFVDLACHKEGEQIITPLLEHSMDRDWRDVPSVSYLNSEGQLIQNQLARRIRELDEIPSPYLSGVFDALIEAHPDQQWRMMIETNRGCPYSCTFCDWGSATQAKLYQFATERLLRELDWAGEHGIEYIFCCDANFGILSRDVELAKYAAEVRRRLGSPKTLSIQTAKVGVESIYRVWKAVIDGGLNREVALPLQSADEPTLQAVKRINISMAGFRELNQRFARDDIRTYTDVILAMPGETYDSFLESVSSIISNGQHFRIQFINCSVLPNAPMADPAYREKYGLETVQMRVAGVSPDLNGGDEVAELQELVVGTRTMPRPDWVRVKVFALTTLLLHFSRTLQIPLILLHHLGGLSFRDMLEAFTDDRVTAYPTLAEIQRFFTEAALEIQSGGPEYTASDRYPGVRMFADDLVLVMMHVDRSHDIFYREAEHLLRDVAEANGSGVSWSLIEEAIRFNAWIIKGASQNTETRFQASFNVWEVFQGLLKGIEVPIEHIPCQYAVDRNAHFYQCVRRNSDD